jgi:hypothetical protein
MKVKCPKKTKRWVHLGRLLLFYKSYRRPIMKHTKEKRPDMIPADKWWVITYAVSPTIDSVNFKFSELQTKSLLIAHQEALVQKLLGIVITMLGIEILQHGDVLRPVLSGLHMSHAYTYTWPPFSWYTC